MKLLLVTADGASQMIDYPEALPLLRVPFRVRYSIGEGRAMILDREYVLVDELRSRAMREPLFVYEERVPGTRPALRVEQEIPMCRDIRVAADPDYPARVAQASNQVAAARPPADVYGRSPLARALEEAVRDQGRGFGADLPPRRDTPAPMPAPPSPEGRPVSQLELTMFLVDNPRSNKQDQAGAILKEYDVRHRPK